MREVHTITGLAAGMQGRDLSRFDDIDLLGGEPSVVGDTVKCREAGGVRQSGLALEGPCSVSDTARRAGSGGASGRQWRHAASLSFTASWMASSMHSDENVHLLNNDTGRGETTRHRPARSQGISARSASE
jgi:hypothetical protein